MISYRRIKRMNDEKLNLRKDDNEFLNHGILSDAIRNFKDIDLSNLLKSDDVVALRYDNSKAHIIAASGSLRLDISVRKITSHEDIIHSLHKEDDRPKSVTKQEWYKNDVLSLKNYGMSQKEISRILNISQSLVSFIISINKTSDKSIVYDTQLEQDVCKLRESGARYNEIESQLKISNPTVYKILCKYGMTKYR